MNGTTRCSGNRSKTHGQGVLLCPLRETCWLYRHYRIQKPDAIYEIVPPFIGAQCDHYYRIRNEDQR